MYERISLSRECEAIEIPSGRRVRLPAGTEVFVTQALGGMYTVTTDDGYMVRISERDADALGKTVEARGPAGGGAAGTAAAGSPEAVEQLVWEQLRTCYDPEIPVNIVDLGLVYRCDVRPLTGGGYRVEVDITLTAPGCGMGPVLAADVQSKILEVPGVETADVQVVFEPAWHPGLMSEAARLELGMM